MGRGSAVAADGWPITSVGAFPTGLPPHVHGASYLLLLQGTKDWALWPPERGLPEPARQSLPPPLLRTNASAVLRLLHAADDRPSRPLACRQRPGDVVVLPAGTHHATLNGASAPGRPVLGVGGQSAWPLDERLRLADSLLEGSGGESIAGHSIAGMALATKLRSGTLSEAVAAETAEVAAWHLRRALTAEPSEARVALALADILPAEQGVAVVQSVVAELEALLSEGGGVSAASEVAVAAGMRRLGGWLVQHGERELGTKILKTAFGLDPEPMRRSFSKPEQGSRSDL